MRLADVKTQYGPLYLRLWKWSALGSLFSLGALKTGDPSWLCFFGFLFFLVTLPSRRRRQA